MIVRSEPSITLRTISGMPFCVSRKRWAAWRIAASSSAIFTFTMPSTDAGTPWTLTAPSSATAIDWTSSEIRRATFTRG
jgi:hypothetical protein